MLSASCCCPDGFLSTREFCKINEVLAIRETPSWDHWDHEGSFKNVWMKPSAMNLIQTMGTPGTPWSIRWLKKGAKMVRNIQWAPGRCGVFDFKDFIVERLKLGLCVFGIYMRMCFTRNRFWHIYIPLLAKTILDALRSCFCCAVLKVCLPLFSLSFLLKADCCA